MLRFPFKAALVAAAMVVMALSAAVRADPLQYYVQGTFTAGSTSAVVSSTLTGDGDHVGVSSVTLGGNTIRFTNDLTVLGTSFAYFDSGTKLWTIPNLPASGTHMGTRFGGFDLNPAGGLSTVDFTGVGFTLKIFQVTPAVAGSVSFVGGLSGQFSGVQLVMNSPTVKYNPNAGTGWPPGVRYEVTNMLELQPGPTLMQGNVSAAPLPAITWLGSALFGGLGLGGLKKLRGRRSPVAA